MPLENLCLPRLTVDLSKLAHNSQKMVEYCGKYGIGITAVTKVFCGDPVIAKTLVDHGIAMLGDSRLQNLQKLSRISAEKWMLRLPMPSEADELVRYADVSLNSEITTLEALNNAAQEAGKIHKVVLMLELGDIREGIIQEEELLRAARFTANASNLELYGIGTNLTCFSFVQPDREKMERLATCAHRIEAVTGKPLQIISCGNSSAINQMLQGEISDGLNNLRLGQCLLFAKERATYRDLPGMFTDAFKLELEIIELKEKPSMPWGILGCDSYGRYPVFKDKGVRKRAICAAGKQDLDSETMDCLDPNVTILGASSDHLMLDVTQGTRTYHVGDKISFRLGYFATLRAFTSEYVTKEFLGGPA